MSDVLVWERDPILDTYTTKVGDNVFISMRTWCDVAVLYKDGVEIRRSPSDGSHLKNIKYVEEWARGDQKCHQPQ